MARAPACRDVRGVDTTYTWYTGLGGAAADGVALNGLPLRRNLSGGRFGDLFVTGAPSPDGQGRVLAPTRAGVIVIGSTGPEGTYAKADPAFLVPDATGLPLALGPAGAMPLTGADRPACGALADLPARLPEDARVLRSHRVAPDAVEVLVATQEGKRLALLVPCAAVQDAVTWSLPLDVTDRSRFRAIGSDVAEGANRTTIFLCSQPHRNAAAIRGTRVIALHALRGHRASVRLVRLAQLSGSN